MSSFVHSNSLQSQYKLMLNSMRFIAEGFFCLMTTTKKKHLTIYRQHKNQFEFLLCRIQNLHNIKEKHK